MKYLDAALAARAYRAGRALRTARFCHRRLPREPLAVVLWQLGAEPFSAAAIGWGTGRGHPTLAVAGEPRNRDLAFTALLRFAQWFNHRFELHASHREEVRRGSYTGSRVLTAPQVVVANRATVEMLGRLGRRLAYLPTDGAHPADPDLVRLGRHLLFLWNHWARPGQQLLVSLGDILCSHWATPQSELERQSLAALDAFIDPPAGTDGFEAAMLAERQGVIGPLPDGDDDEDLAPLVEQFNNRRAGGTDLALISPLLAPIEDHYRPLVHRTWQLLWRCLDRELGYPEAPSVQRRWDDDRQAYTGHIDWMARCGLRRTRQTPRQAALTLKSLEHAKERVVAEEACDDALRMIPYLLENKAVRGRVLGVDRTHMERGNGSRSVRRPLVVLHSPDLCPIPPGRELYWTGQPDGREFVVQSVVEADGGGCLVILKLMTGSGDTELPAEGSVACFSIHTIAPPRWSTLPEEPWTHRPAQTPEPVNSIEDGDGRN